MQRFIVLATACVALAGCRSQQPIGYTPTPSSESGRSDPPPEGGGGYDFGADERMVMKKCAEQGGAYKHSGQVSTCATRHQGLAQVTLVEYCKSAVCRIHSLVILDSQEAKNWLVPFEYLRRQLQGRYGTPDENKSELPADCESVFADCVKSGKASATMRWRWDDGHAVMLRLGTTDQVPAAISVSYSAAKE